MKIKILSLYNIITDALLVVGKQVWRSINSHYNTYINICMALLAVGTLFDLEPEFQSRFLSFLFQVAILMAFKYVLGVIQTQKKAQAYEFPMLPKRLTIKESGGFVYVKKSDYQKMVLYLAELEDYFERTGISQW